VAFKVVADDYVTDDSGTGVVHCAPAFGEDDYWVCLLNGIIQKVSASSVLLYIVLFEVLLSFLHVCMEFLQLLVEILFDSSVNLPSKKWRISLLFEETTYDYGPCISFAIHLSSHGEMKTLVRWWIKPVQAPIGHWDKVCRVQTYQIQWIVMATSLRRSLISRVAM
jgi:hypothetical protein